MSYIDHLSLEFGLTCSGKMCVDLYVTEHCPTYITFADLGILSQLLVSGFGLNSGEVVDLTEEGCHGARR